MIKKCLQILILVIYFPTLVGCDPGFDYVYNGKVTTIDGSPIADAEVHCKLFQGGKLDNEANIRTNKDGKFIITIQTITENYQMVELEIKKTGWKNRLEKSKYRDWSVERSFNYRKSTFDFGVMTLEK